MSARWRKQPDETSVRAVCQTQRGYELREHGEWVIKVAPVIDRRRDVRGWYWYGLGQNTCGTPKATKEEAKAEADAYYKAWKKTQEGKCRHATGAS